MSDVNHVILIGRLTRDAELKFTAGGAAVMTFSLALNRKKKQGDQWVDEANFFDVTLFGKQGEAIKNYMTKGKQVAVEGSLKQDRWEKEGQNHSKVYVIADNVQLLGGGQGQDSGGGRSGEDRQERKAPPSRQSAPPPADDEFTDDIPF